MESVCFFETEGVDCRCEKCQEKEDLISKIEIDEYPGSILEQDLQAKIQELEEKLELQAAAVSETALQQLRSRNEIYKKKKEWIAKKSKRIRVQVVGQSEEVPRVPTPFHPCSQEQSWWEAVQVHRGEYEEDEAGDKTPGQPVNAVRVTCLEV